MSRKALLPVLAALVALGAPPAFSQEARITGSFTSGGFRAPSDAVTLWSAGVEAEGGKEWPDIVLEGRFSFTQDYGTGMCGSMFTEPGLYPVDVLEFTPGDKSRQRYDIGGGIRWNKGRWLPGAEVFFRGVNYTKRKDLRHTTYRQEADFAPYLRFRADGWEAEARYTLGKRSEFIQAEQIGPAKAESYYAFLDKGARYGTYQAWDGSGVHLAEPGVDRFPVKEISHAAQLSLAAPFGLEASTAFRYALGEAGEKGYTWFRFPTLEWEAQAAWGFGKGSFRHRLEASFHWMGRSLYENVLEKVSEDGVTTPSIMGDNRVFREKEMDLTLAYRMARADGLAFGLTLQSQGCNMLSTTMFPFWDLDRSTHVQAGLRAEVPIGRAFLLSAGAAVGGSIDGHRHTSDTDDEGIGVDSRPFHLAEWYDMENELNDALQTALSLSLRYTLKSFYLEAGCDFTHAFRVETLPGMNRQTTHLTLGYKW